MHKYHILLIEYTGSQHTYTVDKFFQGFDAQPTTVEVEEAAGVEAEAVEVVARPR